MLDGASYCFFRGFAFLLRLAPDRTSVLAAGNAMRLARSEAGNAAVRFGSCFHQFKPICSALSTEQIRSRILTVSNSTFAREIRISPAMTKPLSRTRSRISTRLVVPDTVGTRSIRLRANTFLLLIGFRQNPRRRRLLYSSKHRNIRLSMEGGGFSPSKVHDYEEIVEQAENELDVRCRVSELRLYGRLLFVQKTAQRP